MERRNLLRRAGASIAAGLTVGLSGCAGGDSGGDGTGGEDGETSDPDTEDEPTEETSEETTSRSESTEGPATAERESIGSVAENSVDGLELVGWESRASGDQFEVTVTVENAGEENTDAFNYSYSLTLYDANGDDITDLPSGLTPAEQTEVAPGERTRLAVTSGVDGDPDDVDRYEIILTCDGFGADGVYCE